MHFLKKGQKIRAWVDPLPLIRAMPERKRFFSVNAFPKEKCTICAVYDCIKTYEISQRKLTCHNQLIGSDYVAGF